MSTLSQMWSVRMYSNLQPPRPYCAYFRQVLAALTAPTGDNTLINRKMNYDCSLAAEGTTCTSNAGLSKFNFTAGKTHRLRLINMSGTGLHLFSIDGHEMTVISMWPQTPRMPFAPTRSSLLQDSRCCDPSWVRPFNCWFEVTNLISML
jgi:hypothetical protein